MIFARFDPASLTLRPQYIGEHQVVELLTDQGQGISSNCALQGLRGQPYDRKQKISERAESLAGSLAGPRFGKGVKATRSPGPTTSTISPALPRWSPPNSMPRLGKLPFPRGAVRMLRGTFQSDMSSSQSGWKWYSCVVASVPCRHIPIARRQWHPWTASLAPTSDERIMGAMAAACWFLGPFSCQKTPWR